MVVIHIHVMMRGVDCRHNCTSDDDQKCADDIADNCWDDDCGVMAEGSDDGCRSESIMELTDYNICKSNSCKCGRGNSDDCGGDS